MTNAPTLNAKAAPYNLARNSQESEMDNRKGNLKGNREAVHIRETRRSSKLSPGT
jgi:hypothetical protein